MEMVMKFQANLLGVQLKSERASIDKSSTKIVLSCTNLFAVFIFAFCNSFMASSYYEIKKVIKLFTKQRSLDETSF